MSFSINNLHRIPPSSSAIGRTKRNALRSAIGEEGFLYSTQLKEHTGCVNAIALSNGEGRWLATGGDDLEVLLWDLHSDLSPPPPAQAAPSNRFAGHQANIFGISFDSTDTHLFSSGLDGLVHRYDLSRLGSSATPAAPEGPDRTVHINDSAVRGISSHPENPNLLLVAREDNRLYLHDFRLPSTVVHKLASADSWSGVSWSPVGGHLFAGCDEGGALRLFDVRKSFEGTSSAQYTRISAQSFRNALVDYITPKAIFSDLAGVSFSPNGNVLATNVLGYYPIVYSVGEPKPLAVLTTPPKQYRNRVTVKHGGFGPIGKNGETTYVTGSDDYYGYGWTIPTPDALAEETSQVSEGPTTVERIDHKQIWANQNVPEGFAPTDLHQPSIRVGGHNSIVNSALLHPYLPLLITSGVESRVHLHSPFPFPSSSSDTPTPTPPSRIPGGPYTLEWRNETNDWETLLSFDRLVGDEEDDEDYQYFSEEDLLSMEDEEDGDDDDDEDGPEEEDGEEAFGALGSWLGPLYRRDVERERERRGVDGEGEGGGGGDGDGQEMDLDLDAG